MTEQEYLVYQVSEIPRFAEANVTAGNWDPADALARAKSTHDRILPQGRATADHHFFVLEERDGSRRVGNLWAFIDRSTSSPSVFVFDLFVEPADRGRGYGERAMLALEDWARSQSAAKMALHVFATNESARKLYEKLGYRPTSVNLAKAL